MANSDLKTFIEDRLLALDPTIDLDPGSPAQIQFIEPLLTRLGTDPLETNIDAFLTDRFSQEFPDIFAGDPSAIRDVFIKPLVLFLEPFKREINTLKNNQSLKDPTILSDEDADALVANVFDERDTGGFAVGAGRIYFSQPTNQQVDITTRFFTSDSLGFFPTNPIGITAEQMVFQKSGNLFYMDVPLRAEVEGAEYNIDVDQLVGVEGVFGALRVTNTRKFENGAVRLDTPSFVAAAQQSLTERSLVTRRGATARLRSEFQTDVRAIQVIGAKDLEMQRDIIVAASPGHAWLVGRVNFSGNIAYVQIRTIDGSIDDAPVSGDTLYVYLDRYSYSGTWLGLTEDARFLRFTVEEILTARMEEASPFRCSYLVRWSGDIPVGITIPSPAILEGGFSKKSIVRISSLPDIGPVSIAVPSSEVHVYGHTDIYARPILQSTSKAAITSLSDERSFIERQTLKTTSGSNVVQDDSYDFLASDVQPGDVLVIEIGNDSGLYVIHKVESGTPGQIRISANLSTTDSSGSIRYRIVRNISINPFEPKVSKFPFGDLSANDLATTIGSNLFVLSTDIINFGAAIGDTFRILSGSDVGDFVITGFDSTLGGRGILVDRQAGASNSSIQYQVFTALENVELPLVRIKQFLLLDSAKQSTGITIPPAEPVAIVPTCDFSSARVRGNSQRKSGYVLPDFAGYISGGNIAAPSGDRRYSLGFDPFTGIYRWVQFPDGSSAEFDFREDAIGSCSYFLAISESTDDTTNYPPIDPRPGECLTLKNGPNQGSYLIKNVIKFKHKLNTPARDVWSYFIKVYGTFQVDVYQQLITFLDAAQTAGASGAGVTKITGSGAVLYPDFFFNTINGLGAKLHTALTFYGATSPGVLALQSAVDQLTEIEYEWGDPARGVLRSYFSEPTLFQQYTAENSDPTTYLFKIEGGDYLHFRPEPFRYSKQELVPARLSTDADLVDYPRDSDFSVSSQATFDTSSRQTMFNLGVAAGDILSVCEEIFFHGTDKTRQTAVMTVQGSTQITAPSTSGNIFTEEMEGNIIFIEEGDDEGGYRVVTFTDGKNLVLDRPLTVTTPSILVQAVVSSWGHNGTNNVVTSTSFNFTPYINKFITIYGMDYQWEGSYEITSAPSLGTAVISKSSPNFPGSPTLHTEADAHFVITDAPTTTPSANASGNGTELYSLRPIRMYDDVQTEVTITAVTSSPTLSRVNFSGTIKDGLNQPFRIFAGDIRRITPTEMASKIFGPLFYFDTEVVSLEPQSIANLSENSYLTIDPNTYDSFGYRHVVDDSNLTYSMLESGRIEFPTSILPIDSADSLDNFLTIINSPIEVSYERADVVQRFQEFLDSPQDRVTSASMLARHFLPAYISYDADYVGGSAPSVIAADIFAYIDTIPVEEPVDISEIEKLIVQRGGNPSTPTEAIMVLHDWDRKMWAEFSEDQVGGDKTKVPYNGTPRVSFCIPGPDASGQNPLPSGERINLTRN